MSYCTVSRIDDAIAIAESIVDGMIAKRYTVPLSSPPGNIQAVTADLAASALL